jgi:hypothetical protein
VSADDSNETVAGPTGGGSPEAGTPWRRTTEMFGPGRMEREWSTVQRRGAGAEGASLNTQEGDVLLGGECLSPAFDLSKAAWPSTHHPAARRRGKEMRPTATRAK